MTLGTRPSTAVWMPLHGGRDGQLGPAGGQLGPAVGQATAQHGQGDPVLGAEPAGVDGGQPAFQVGQAPVGLGLGGLGQVGTSASQPWHPDTVASNGAASMGTWKYRSAELGDVAVHGVCGVEALAFRPWRSAAPSSRCRR